MISRFSWKRICTYQHAVGSVNLENFPNSCEKAVALKTIWNHAERIHSAETKEELILAIHRMQDVTEVFQKIIDRSEVNSNESKELARKYVALSYVLRSLNDTRAGFPAGARSILLDRSVTQPGVEDLQGYAYALEYIWFQRFSVNRNLKIHQQKNCIKHLIC